MLLTLNRSKLWPDFQQGIGVRQSVGQRPGMLSEAAVHGNCFYYVIGINVCVRVGPAVSIRRDCRGRYRPAQERNLVIGMGVVDNLGKGAAAQAVQNANLICALPETAGLDGLPVWP